MYPPGRERYLSEGGYPPKKEYPPPGDPKISPPDTLSGYLPPWRILSLGQYPPPSIADTSSLLDTSPSAAIFSSPIFRAGFNL